MLSKPEPGGELLEPSSSCAVPGTSRGRVPGARKAHFRMRLVVLYRSAVVAASLSWSVEAAAGAFPVQGDISARV